MTMDSFMVNRAVKLGECIIVTVVVVDFFKC